MTTTANALLGSELATELEKRTAAPRVRAGAPSKSRRGRMTSSPSSSQWLRHTLPSRPWRSSRLPKAPLLTGRTVFVMYEEMNRLPRSRIARQNFYIVFIPMADRIEGIVDVMGKCLRADYFALMIFYRLFIPAMFPEYDKSIYLGSDAVVPGDIAQLYDEDLGDDLIGACLDLSIHDVPELVHYIEDAIGVGLKNTSIQISCS